MIAFIYFLIFENRFLIVMLKYYGKETKKKTKKKVIKRIIGEVRKHYESRSCFSISYKD